MQPNRTIDEKQDEMGRLLGKNGCKQTRRRKRGRPQLRWEDCVRRLGEDERWREGADDRKIWKERTDRVARQYFT